MKLTYLKLAILLITTIVRAQSYAYDFEVDGLYFRVISSQEKTCEVVYDNSDVNKARTGEVVIPDEVVFRGSKLSVTNIAHMAFYDCSNVTSFVLPASLTNIESLAFGNCALITYIDITETVRSIGWSAFENCLMLKTIELPPSITEIKKSTFSGCESLDNLDLPAGITDIDDYAFADCKNFTEIKLPSNLHRIGEGAFNGCLSVENLFIPQSVSFIGKEAFYNCNALLSVEFEKSSQSLKICSDNGMSMGWKAYYVFDPNGNIEKIKTGRTLIYEPAKFQSLTTLEIGDNVSVSNFTCGENIEHLILGQNVTFNSSWTSEIGMTTYFRNYPNLKTIKCYDSKPTFYPNCTQDQYLNVYVFVPNESIAIYKNSESWKNFWFLEGFELPASIEQIKCTQIKYPLEIFDLNGISHNKPVKGLNLIRYSDGTIEKMVLK